MKHVYTLPGLKGLENLKEPKTLEERFDIMERLVFLQGEQITTILVHLTAVQEEAKRTKIVLPK